MNDIATIQAETGAETAVTASSSFSPAWRHANATLDAIRGAAVHADLLGWKDVASLLHDAHRRGMRHQGNLTRAENQAIYAQHGWPDRK